MLVVTILLERQYFCGIALKQLIDKVGGKVIVLGCPMKKVEKMAAKATYVKEGVIDELDIALMVHPGNETYRTINTLAVDVLDIKFYGKVHMLLKMLMKQEMHWMQ